MTLEMKAMGNVCNLACTYCYQEPLRQAGNLRASHKYDLDLMMKIADRSEEAEQGYVLFGGEPLLMPIQDVEYLFSESFRKYGRAAIQTNGSLITPDHIELFKKYNVGVGLSIDGPNELNHLRVPANPRQDVQTLTEKTMENMRLMSAAGVSAGLILTVHRLNGVGDNLNRLINFIRWAGDLGHRSGNLHMMEVDSPNAAEYCLTAEENEEAWMRLSQFFDENRDLHFDPFREMEEMAKGENRNASCIWQSCDPMYTKAVYGVEGNGQVSNCGMVNKEGIEWTKSSDNHFMRDLILYQTEPEYGGCKGCPYFLVCNGYCPGSSEEGDWRNKTTYCSTIKKMYAYYEAKAEENGHVPLSKRPDRIAMEEKQIELIQSGLPRRHIYELAEIVRSED